MVSQLNLSGLCGFWGLVDATRAIRTLEGPVPCGGLDILQLPRSSLESDMPLVAASGTRRAFSFNRVLQCSRRVVVGNQRHRATYWPGDHRLRLLNSHPFVGSVADGQGRAYWPRLVFSPAQPEESFKERAKFGNDVLFFLAHDRQPRKSAKLAVKPQ